LRSAESPTGEWNATRLCSVWRGNGPPPTETNRETGIEPNPGGTNHRDRSLYPASLARSASKGCPCWRCGLTGPHLAFGTEDRLALVAQRVLGQLRPADGVVAHLHRRVRPLARTQTGQEILAVRLGRQRPLHFLDRRPHRLVAAGVRVKAITVVVQLQRRLVALENDVPTVLVRIGVRQGPRRQK